MIRRRFLPLAFAVLSLATLPGSPAAAADPVAPGAAAGTGAGASGAAPPKLPPGVSAELYAIAVPPDRAPTPDRVALGEKLFNDTRLSADGTVACATCHVPERGFVDHKPV